MVTEEHKKNTLAWLNALESGEYAQGIDAMLNVDHPTLEIGDVPPEEGEPEPEKTWCCLGVGCDILPGTWTPVSDFVNNDGPQKFVPEGWEPGEWMQRHEREHRIEDIWEQFPDPEWFQKQYGLLTENEIDGTGLPQAWMGNGMILGYLADANDKGMSFSTIADLIRLRADEVFGEGWESTVTLDAS
jgi:hypothetical protein